MMTSSAIVRLLLACSLVGSATSCANVLDYDEVEFETGETHDAGADVTSQGDGGRTDQETGVEDADARSDSFTDPEAGEAGEASYDPCATVDCGLYGVCVVEGIAPSCSCIDGYHAEGLACVEDAPPDPCDNVQCGENAGCVNGLCVCDDGYEGDADLGCAEPNPLEAQVRAELVSIAMAEKGYCEGVDDRPYMQNQPGLWCYDFVAWVYAQSSYSIPSPMSLPEYQTGSLPAGWRPEPGDLIKFNIQHYGMVAEVSADGTYITTIEGNVNSCVMSRATTDGSVEYYGSLDQVF